MTRRRRRVLPKMPLTTIVTRLEATDEEFRELPPRCFLGVSLASSPFAESPEDNVAAFVIDETALPACTRIRWGGVGVVEAPMETRHLLTAYFGHPLRQAMYDWRDVRERGEGRDAFVSCGFHRVGHGLGVSFL